MTFSVMFHDEPPANPLEIVEQFVSANDWPFERRNDDEMAVEVPGQWCDYSLYFAWRPEVGAMHFTCAFNLKVVGAKKPAIYELMAHLNDKLWLGHFGLWTDESVPLFRHSVLMRGPAGTSVEEVEDLVDIALTECERFYPAFQYVIWGGKSPSEAIAAAMFDTVGEA